MLNHVMLFIMDIKHVFCLILKKEQLIKDNFISYSLKQIDTLYVPYRKNVKTLSPIYLKSCSLGVK